MLSLNPNNEAIALLKAQLKQNPDKIDWRGLSANSNDGAIALLKANQDKIEWEYLSWNSHNDAIALLKANQDTINWQWLSENPNIFKLNTNKIYTALQVLA
jgi:tripartite-type tricarboxylate transporter receptor subunit TctC